MNHTNAAIPMAALRRETALTITVATERNASAASTQATISTPNRAASVAPVSNNTIAPPLPNPATSETASAAA